MFWFFLRIARRKTGVLGWTNNWLSAWLRSIIKLWFCLEGLNKHWSLQKPRSFWNHYFSVSYLYLLNYLSQYMDHCKLQVWATINRSNVDVRGEGSDIRIVSRRWKRNIVKRLEMTALRRSQLGSNNFWPTYFFRSFLNNFKRSHSTPLGIMNVFKMKFV